MLHITPFAINSIGFDTINKIIINEININVKSGNKVSSRKLSPIALYIAHNTNSYFELGCYKSGDTIPRDAISDFSILKMKSGFQPTNGKICLTADNTYYINDFNFRPEMIDNVMKEKIREGDAHFPYILRLKLNDNDGITFLEPVFYISKNGGKRCYQINSQIITYKGKLLMGKDKDEPVQNQKVILKDKSDKEIQSTTTDKYGDFTFKNIKTIESYKIVLDATTAKIKDDVVYMAKQDGTIVEVFNKTGSSFTYELLPAELTKLTKMEEVDTELKIRNFSSSTENKLTVIENIYYATNSADITTDSEKKLDKIIKSMQDNKSLKLAIASHTDSKGDDASNMTLSEKRAQKVMEYFISKGITKERLSAKGYGETQILNRCKNGIDCSEMENELNRRTEFKFTK